MKKFLQSPIFRWVSLALLVISALIAALAIRPEPPSPAPFIVWHQPFQMPVTVGDRVDRCIPRTRGWAWVWRVEQSLFGKRKPVCLNGAVESLTDSSLSGLSLGKPGFSDSKGLQGWLLPTNKLNVIREQLKQTHGTDLLAGFRISTADGVYSHLFQGTSVPVHGVAKDGELSVGCYPRTRPDSTDLITSVTLAEALTNLPVLPDDGLLLHAVLRMQIPHGSGVFLLNRASPAASAQSIGVILDLPRN